MAFTLASIPDLSGTVTVVTGANGGLGLETAKALAAHGAHVVMAARNQHRAEDGAGEIRAQTPAASLSIVPLDLGSLASVRAAAEQIAAQHPAIDVLVNNAGVMAMPEGKTVDGFETQLGVDHLGHWALTALLMPQLLNAPRARVVTVTSTAHHMGRAIDPRNPNLQGNYGAWKAYGQAKLANYHFGLGLQQEFQRAQVRAISLLAHPGLSHTGLQVTTVAEGGAGVLGTASAWLSARTGMSAADGAMPQIRAATDPRARGGDFYAPRYLNNGPAVRRPILRPGNSGAIAKLWLVSERETGIPMKISR